VTEFWNSAFGSTVVQRWGARFKATPALLELTAKHRVPLQSARTHFTFKYELPEKPLEKRTTKLTHGYASSQVGGLPMPFDHTEASRKLEAEVRELNEFLAQQRIEGGDHQGYPSRSTYHNWCKQAREHGAFTLDVDVLTRISAVLRRRHAYRSRFSRHSRVRQPQDCQNLVAG
jgi:hypothetical protein